MLIALENLKAIVTTIIEQMFGQEGFVSTQKDGRCFSIKKILVELLLDQLFTVIHNLFTPTIYNRVELMQTKVNRNS
jgi:flagellar motor switch protein FliM